MCQQRNFSPIVIRRKWVHIDYCLSGLIEHLNEIGIRTLSCCCGHDRYPPTIVVWHKEGGLEINSQVVIKRKKRFYKKDKNGYYYIPEALKGRCKKCT